MVRALYPALLAIALSLGEGHVSSNHERLMRIGPAVSVSESSSHETLLRKKLLKDYDKDSIPNVKTNVSVAFTVLHIDMDEEKQILIMDAWVKMMWNDTRLSWDASLYKDIERIAFPKEKIWRPDLTLYNNARPDIPDPMGDPLVLVWPTGKVMHVPMAVFPLACVLDMTYWPHDVHNCTAKFGSWVYSGHSIHLQEYEGQSRVKFEMPKKAGDGTPLSRGSWEVVCSDVSFKTKTYDCCPEPYMHVAFQIVVKRNAPAFCWLVKVPAITLSILTTVLFLLPPGSVEKAVVGALLLLLDMLFISSTADIVKHSPSHTPLIVQFVGEQLLLTMVCVIVSVLIVRLVRDPHSDSLPPWLQKTVAILECWLCVAGYKSLGNESNRRHYPPLQDSCEDQTAMVMDNSTSGGSVHEAHSADWLKLGAVLDRCLLLIYIATILIRLIAYHAII